MERRAMRGRSSRIRSRASECGCRVSFKNLTGAMVSLYWIDFHGKKRLYGRLNPVKRRDDGFIVNTFVSHPWIAEDSETKEKVRVNFCRIFFPPAPQNVLGVSERKGMWNLMYLCRKNNENVTTIPSDGDRSQSMNANNEQSESRQLRTGNDVSPNAYEVLVTKSVFSLELLSSLVICQFMSRQEMQNLPLPSILKHRLDSTYIKWY